MPLALNLAGYIRAISGELALAKSLLDEIRAATSVDGTNIGERSGRSPKLHAVTARGSRIAPTTLVYGAGAGVAGGLIVYAATWPGRGFLDGNPLLPAVVILVLPAMMLGASVAAARRVRSRTDPEAVRHKGWREGLVAGGLTGAVAALLITTSILGTMVILHHQLPAPTTEAYFSVALLGPLIGMLVGSITGAAAYRPSPQPEGPPSVLSVD
jgi:hypothetical protein